ncbi:MAG: hypothetical protein Q9213_006405 [Squamulea squamosa]
MAKTKPSKKNLSVREPRGTLKNLDRVLPDRPNSKKPSEPKESAEGLLARSSALLQTAQAEEALPLALRALKRLRKEASGLSLQLLPALSLIAEINLELGDADEARNYFLQASQLDPDGLISELQGGGVEKFLWLAQLSEEGGQDSVSWYEKAITVLRNESSRTIDTALKAQKSKKLATALCSVIEIYMTDLSWEADAEPRCESLITEAMLIAPDTPEALQTLANVRISQERVDEAKKALADSLELWKDLPSGNESVPDFPTRISLARLLMEVEMENDAMEVLERLVEEDDTSVEAWYLGGWCSYLTAERSKISRSTATNSAGTDCAEDAVFKAMLMSSRGWLRNSLRLYDLQDYEDDRLRDHALELVRDLDDALGDAKEEEDEEREAGEEVWESDTENEDHEMDGT